jgi:hypothetical protein
MSIFFFFPNTEEVVESGTGQCPSPEKYHNEGDEEEGDDGFHWLKPEEFVERYKQSSYFTHVEKRIKEISNESQALKSSGESKPVLHLSFPFWKISILVDSATYFLLPNRIDEARHRGLDQSGLQREHQVPHVRVVAVLAPHPALLRQALAR